MARKTRQPSINPNEEVTIKLLQIALSLFLAACAIALVASCASVGRKIDQAAVDQIKKGSTTKADVLQSLGSPEQVTIDPNGGVIFQYVYVRATAKPATFIPIVGAFAGGADVQNHMVMITFDSDGIVKDVVSTYGVTESGLGVSAGGKADIPDLGDNKRPK